MLRNLTNNFKVKKKSNKFPSSILSFSKKYQLKFNLKKKKKNIKINSIMAVELI